jgi:hypothetical protein
MSVSSPEELIRRYNLLLVILGGVEASNEIIDV